MRESSIMVFQKDTNPLLLFEDAFRREAPQTVREAYDEGKPIGYEDGTGWLLMPTELKS